MIQRSTSRSRLGLVSAAVVALLIMSTGSVFADTTPPTDGSFSQTGKSADASSSACVSNGDDTVTCTDVGISVFVGRMSDSFSGKIHANQVCVNHVDYTYNELTGEFVDEPVYEYGCSVDLPAGAISFGSRLSSVTLRPLTVTIDEFVCDKEACVPGSSRNVAVAGTWTGIGPIISSKYRYSNDDGVCRYGESGKGSNREATFVGSVDGAGFDGDVWAFIADGKSSYRSRCSEI